MRVGNNSKKKGSFLQRLRPGRGGQSITEYAILLAITAAALIAMQVYMRRSVQAHIKDVYDFSSTANYTPDPGQDRLFELPPAGWSSGINWSDRPAPFVSSFSSRLIIYLQSSW